MHTCSSSINIMMQTASVKVLSWCELFAAELSAHTTFMEFK